jgi:hypothetical protein
MNVVIKTGIKSLDDMLGGGILDDSVVLIIYDTYSLGWSLAIELFKGFLERDCFGVVTSYSLPLSMLEKYADMLGFDVEGQGEMSNLVVLDIFGAVNGIPPTRPFVRSPGSVDSSTFLPKVSALYYEVLRDAGSRKPVGLTVALDGFATMFGEDSAMKLFQRNIAMKEMARASEDRPRPINLMLLNKDRVSKRFLSWMSHYSEHIIEFEPTDVPGREKLLVRKSLLPDFEPGVAEFMFSRGKARVV